MEESTAIATIETPVVEAIVTPETLAAAPIENVVAELPPAEIAEVAEARAPSAKAFTMEYLQEMRAREGGHVSVRDLAHVGGAQAPPAPFSKEALKQQQRTQAPARVSARDANSIVGDYYTNKHSDPFEFLGRLYDASPKRYEALVDAVVDAHENEIHARLAIPRPAHIPEEHLRRLPQHLRETAANLPPGVWETVAHSPREVGLQILEGALEIERARVAEYQRSQERYLETVERAAITARTLAEEISEHYDHQHQKTLDKWKPSADEASNQMLRRLVLHSASQMMAANRAAVAWRQEAYESLKLAGWWRMTGNEKAAAPHVENVTRLAKQFNKAFAGQLQAEIANVDAFLKGEAPKKAEPKSNTKPAFTRDWLFEQRRIDAAAFALGEK
jgi:hypothetical protein